MKDNELLKLIKRDRIKTGFNTEMFSGKRVVINGGAGSIGSELVRILKDVSEVIVVDFNEYATYKLEQEIGNKAKYKVFDIKDENYIFMVKKLKPDYIIHASAYKHVPLMQDNAYSCLTNNIFSLKNAINGANLVNAKLILVSSDKAVNPSNIMGATKNLCEHLVREKSFDYSIVRFGNVMNSSGSVIPKFLEQIKTGKDLEVTGNEMKRYFMLISEACELILMTAKMDNGTYLLDMGKPIRIVELARSMIEYFNAKNRVKLIEKRAGDKMFEELTFNPKTMQRTNIKKIFKINEDKEFDIEYLVSFIPKLQDDKETFKLLKQFYENIDNRS